MCAMGVVVGLGGGACTPAKVDENGPAPTAVPIRRLTNAEYTATVGDLFPGYALPAITFVPDPKVLGFVNLSSSQTGSLVRMEQYEAAAFSIIPNGMRSSPRSRRVTSHARSPPHLQPLAKRSTASSPTSRRRSSRA